VVVGIIGRLDAGGIGRVRTFYWRPTGVYSVVCSGCTVYALRCLCIQVRSKQAGESRRSLAVHRAAPLW